MAKVYQQLCMNGLYSSRAIHALYFGSFDLPLFFLGFFLIECRAMAFCIFSMVRSKLPAG